MKVTRAWLRTQVEQGEPSVDGEWFTLDLTHLLEDKRFRYIEIHFDDESEDPNEVRFLSEAGE